MGKLYSNGVEVLTGFKVEHGTLVDDRGAVQSFTDLEDLVAAKGLISFVDDNDRLYYYNGTSWIGLGKDGEGMKFSVGQTWDTLPIEPREGDIFELTTNDLPIPSNVQGADPVETAGKYQFDGTNWIAKSNTVLYEEILDLLQGKTEKGGYAGTAQDLKNLIDTIISGSSNKLETDMSNLADDLDETEQDEIKTKLNIDEGELKKIGNGYGLQHQIDNPDNYGTLGYKAVNLSYSDDEGDFGATGEASHAEGWNTIASGYSSHAEGYWTTASGSASHAEGEYTTASGSASHAEGYWTTASGSVSHAEGTATTASGDYSHAEGYNTTASGAASHAEGSHTTAGSFSENARGTYNEIITPISANSFEPNDVIESVGVGTSEATRKNALTRWKNGAFKWLLQPLTNITNAVIGFHAADEEGRLNYHDGTEWKKYLIEGEGGSGGGELKKIGDGYGLQHQIDNPTYYGALGTNAINFSYSEDEGSYGATGESSHAEGAYTTASGYASNSEGDSTEASGYASHSEGLSTRAGSCAENARGSFNEIIPPISATNFDPNDVIESVGVGTNNSNRKNALTRWKNGAFKWLLQPLTNITNAVIGFHAADEDGRLNYHDGAEWKKYALEGEGGNGVTPTITENVITSYDIDITSQTGHWNLTMTGDTDFDFTNMFASGNSKVITVTLSGDFAFTFPTWLKPLETNDEYDTIEGTLVAEIVINIKNGGTNPSGYYTLQMVDYAL